MGLPRWQTKESVLLKQVIGRHDLPDGTEEVVLSGFIAVRGQVIEEKELDPTFVKSYDDGDPATLALIERLGEEDSSSEASAEELKGQALERRIDELGIKGTSGMSAAEKRDAVAAAETEDDDGA